MLFPRKLINALVPEGLPKDRFFDVERLNELRFENELFRRSTAWSYALTRRYFMSNRNQRIVHVSAGFLNIPKDFLQYTRNANIADGFSFGIYVLLPPVFGSGSEMRIIRHNGIDFPVIKLHGNVTEHHCPPYSSIGTSTCWAKSDDPHTRWTHGILTCRHTVAQMPLGATVPLSNCPHYKTPTYCTLADIDNGNLEAAILKISPQDFPATAKLLDVHAPAAPGMPVEFEGRSSSQTGSVLRVHYDGRYYGNLFGQRVITDCPGQPGDSGSLVKERGATGKGVGIYIGEIPDGSGGLEAICQDLSQVVKYFKLKLYI